MQGIKTQSTGSLTWSAKEAFLLNWEEARVGTVSQTVEGFTWGLFVLQLSLGR